jgi:hypothetical protein
VGVFDRYRVARIQRVYDLSNRYAQGVRTVEKLERRDAGQVLEGSGRRLLISQSLTESSRKML